jgi:hypothetical protein
MERKARDGVKVVGEIERELTHWPWGQLWGWVITLVLFVGSVVVAPNFRTLTAIGLMLAAYGVQLAVRKQRRTLPSAVVTGAVVTRMLFVEDSKGRTRAWLGVENEYGDEEGPRLVLYDEKGQARLALRLVHEDIEQASYNEGKHAEVVCPQDEDDGDDEAQPKAPALVMFDDDGDISLSVWAAKERPTVEVRAANGSAGVEPNCVWVLSHDLKSTKMTAA